MERKHRYPVRPGCGAMVAGNYLTPFFGVSVSGNSG
jgi:hypothetical protein